MVSSVLTCYPLSQSKFAISADGKYAIKMRTQRNRKIVALVDNRVQIDEAKSEINVARIIAEFARSRTNRELYTLLQEEIVPEILAAYKQEIMTDDLDTVQFLKNGGDDLDNFVWEDAMAELAKISYSDRKKSHGLFTERVTKLESKRMNKVIHRYLEVQARRKPHFKHNMGVKAILQLWEDRQ